MTQYLLGSDSSLVELTAGSTTFSLRPKPIVFIVSRDFPPTLVQNRLMLQDYFRYKLMIKGQYDLLDDL